VSGTTPNFRTFNTGPQSERVEAIYRRYLGNDVEVWPRFFRDRLADPEWALWTVTPTSGLVAAFPKFEAREMRWQEPRGSPLPRT
jgi:hypothetical protein